MPKDPDDRRMLVRLLGAARARLDAVRGTQDEVSAQAGLNRATRMLDTYDTHPGDETPSVVVRYLWRPWEHEQVSAATAADVRQLEHAAEADRSADVATSRGRHHAEAHFRTLARLLREHGSASAQAEEQAG